MLNPAARLSNRTGLIGFDVQPREPLRYRHPYAHSSDPTCRAVLPPATRRETGVGGQPRPAVGLSVMGRAIGTADAQPQGTKVR